ncbi:MAG: sigma-70 family RNA polymerase sigma factor [Eubacteriales bacterium]|nr:sigma-70 family RNA polymerase sigma factor [Eubacteriales bacterium]
MDEFEKLLCENRGTIERFVKFRLPSTFDADDVLQEVYIAAHDKYGNLIDKSYFKAWIVGIARHKYNDFYRKRAKVMEIPIDEVGESALSYGRMGVTVTNYVRETISGLTSRDQEMLYLYFFRDMSQADIAKKLGIPVGTVKSRLHTAKANFKKKYPFPPKSKGKLIMKKLPEMMPDYKIEKSDKDPFPVVWEELMGWFLVPKFGEKLSWGLYDMPERKLAESNEMAVVGKAEVHGIEGVEITVKTHNPMEFNSESGKPEVSRRFVAQLTATHCRYLAESHMKDGVNRFYTFLDGESFLGNWSFGENNCGNETHIKVKGDVIRNGSVITTADKPFLLDIVGRYNVTIGGKSYDTICVIDAETYNPGVVSEQYLDKEGRTILWRRFNRDDWAYDHYRQKWSEKLPDNERLTINGKTYVHWYDCITDYILT